MCPISWVRVCKTATRRRPRQQQQGDLLQKQIHRSPLCAAPRGGLLAGPSLAHVSRPPLCAPLLPQQVLHLPPADTTDHTMAGPGVRGWSYALASPPLPPGC